MIYPALLSQFPIISEQITEKRLASVLRLLEGALAAGQSGAVVEFGCYVGTTSLFVRRLLDAYDFRGEFHVYDSFEGLPEKTGEDASVAGEQFKAGELKSGKKALLMQFKKAHLKPPIVHKNWFRDLEPEDIPQDILFAFLDGDYYRSIRDSFRLIVPQLGEGAVIVVDDYANLALPGAARAVEEYAQAYPPRQFYVEQQLAIIVT